MKKFIYLFVLAMVLSSCEDFLTTEPHDFLAPENYYTSAENVEAGLMSLYIPLVKYQNQGGSNSTVTLYGNNYLIYVLTMDHLQYSTHTGVANNAGIFLWSSSDMMFNRYWRACYLIINRANMFIQNVENLPESVIDPVAKNAMLGEAYFLRGFCYWHLAHNWGGVPIRTSGDLGSAELHVPRASLKETYEQAVSDLTKAESMVYEADHFQHSGRVTKTTAQAMLARVYLYMAGEPLKDASAYEKSLEWSRKVVASGKHRLDPNYEDVFIRMIQEKPDLVYRESMWEVEFWGVDGEVNRTDGTFGGPNGIRCANLNLAFAYNALCVTRTMLNYYAEDANDKRRPWSVSDYEYGSNTTNTKKITITNVEGHYIGKYRKDYCTGPIGRNFTGTNYPAMRYADVLLMLAEAANEVGGPTDEAISALNQVRERAGVALCSNKNEAGKLPLTTREDFRAFVRKERARELCYELTTRGDLLRWGTLVPEIRAAASIMTTALAKRGANNISDNHVLMPIPADELNTNKLMVQNPGW